MNVWGKWRGETARHIRLAVRKGRGEGKEEGGKDDCVYVHVCLYMYMCTCIRYA